MTFYFPDVSNYQSGLALEPHTVAVLAKGSEGSTYRDPTYRGFKLQAAQVGAIFAAYHWLWPGNEGAQAANAYAAVGPDTPLMLDVENLKGINSVSGILTFIDVYTKLGGRVRLSYIPRWYWHDHMGSPSLVPVLNAGSRLVSSDYSQRYSDSGPGWDGYGGVTPYVTQYTDALPYGGQRVDFNACKDTLQGFHDWLYPIGTPTPTPPVVPAGVHQPGTRLLSLQSPQLTGDDVLFVERFVGPKRAGDPDGIFGPHVDAGVRWYQGMRGIRVDGIVGPVTWANMGVTWRPGR